MTIDDIDKLPWAASNMPKKWDFRNKSAADLEPMKFGCYQHSEDRGKCKIVYGGMANAEVAVRELAAMGIEATIQPPTDSILDDDGKAVRIKGWSYAVHFRLSSAKAK